MNKKFLISAILLVVLVSVFIVSKQAAAPEAPAEPIDMTDADTASLPNPASAYCEEQGSTLEIVTSSDGSQFGMCNLGDYLCEEWAYYGGECAVAEDETAILQALKAKGLDLTDMKVVIKKHLGEYIEGAVVPVSAPAGGGYVYAAKTDEGMKVVADGNGVIMCSAFADYPDYPTYLIPECVDDEGVVIER